MVISSTNYVKHGASLDSMDSDVEFDDEWEEVQVPVAQTTAGGGDLTIFLGEDVRQPIQHKH